MTRTYATDHTASWPEGYPLDAHLCMDALIRNPTAYYEESGWDQCVVLSAYETASTGWWFGPLVLPLRFDRDGLLRSISIEPLAKGGSGAATLRAYLTPVYGEPTTDDVNESWSLSSGTTLSWQSSKTITLRREAMPRARHFADTSGGDYRGRSREVYLSFAFDSVATSPRFGGVHVWEDVDS